MSRSLIDENGALQRVKAGLRPFWTGLLDLLYPVRCLSCTGHVPDPALPLCARCIRHLERPTPDEIHDQLDRLPDAAPPLHPVTALWIFEQDGALQPVQHALKYGNRPRYGTALGRLMGQAYISDDQPLPDLIVPIPLHRTRQLERGYNQSTTLAEGLGDMLDVPVRPDALHRPHPTRSQTALSRTDRWANVGSAFATVDAKATADRRILLVDDILTTGSTAAAAAQPLLDAGAVSVGIATLALVRD